jgi:cell division protein FtsB
VTGQTHDRWRREYGGLKVDQARRLTELERENQRLRRAVSDLTSGEVILTQAARGTEGPRRRND